MGFTCARNTVKEGIFFVMKAEQKAEYAKNQYNIQYKKDNYIQITLRIRKDDETAKLLEKYRLLHPSESINSIITKALKLLLKSVFSYVDMQDLK